MARNTQQTARLASVPATPEQPSDLAQPAQQGEIDVLLDMVGLYADRLSVTNQRVHGTFASVLAPPTPGSPPSEAIGAETELGSRLAATVNSLAGTLAGLNDTCDRARF